MAIELKGIKNLLFDLGGVIIDLRRDDCVHALEQLGMSDANEFIGLYKQSGAFLAMEAGEINAAEFRTEMRKHFTVEVTDDEIDRAISCFIVGIPVLRLQALRRLRQSGLRTFVLSNTNPIMFDGIIARLFKQEGLTMTDYFDGITTSYKAGANKPDAAIFHYAERTMGIDPAETLFLDDSQKNLDAAAALGYHTQLVEPGHEFIEYFGI